MDANERLEMLRRLEALLRARLQDNSSKGRVLWKHTEDLLKEAEEFSASRASEDTVTIRTLTASLRGRGVIVNAAITDQNFPIAGSLSIFGATIESLGRGSPPLVTRQEVESLLRSRKRRRSANGGEILLFLDRLTPGQVLARPLFALGQSCRAGPGACAPEMVICASQFLGKIEVALFPVQSGWHRLIYDFLALPM